MAKVRKKKVVARKGQGLRFGTIKQSRKFSATPEQVYNALLDPKIHSVFTGARATCDPKIGGSMTAWDGYITGKFIELSPGKKVVQEWRTEEFPENYPPSLLELTFKPLSDERTELIMVQSKVPKEQVEKYNEGWDENYWVPLEEYFSKK